MKGKHAVASARRREREAIDRARTIGAELREAKAEIVELRRQIREQAVAEAEIQRLREQLAAGTSDDFERVVALNVSLQRQFGEMLARLVRFQEIHDKLLTLEINRRGGGAGGLEKLGAELKLWTEQTRIIENEFQRGLPRRAIESIQRKTGWRR